MDIEEALTKDITDDLVVDGIIQRFEQAWKSMKLHLEDQGILDEAFGI